jgi:hypothetical protein
MPILKKASQQCGAFFLSFLFLIQSSFFYLHLLI